MSEITDRENTQTVSSKYFSSGTVMDESLTDFQEPKILAGLKTAAKKKSDKPKKAPKRIRGQKDIRTALRSKKNELESYTKDFDNVCRQAGLDVDPEQLQLAIALSKSLQSDTNSPETSQSLSSQDRVVKIRTTLLEYGFKVPEIKIKKASKRVRKRKQYKLLITNEEAKKQIIADKYSQVLFQNTTITNYLTSNSDVTHIKLYNLATNATYEILKSIDTFYVDNLLDKSTSTGNLLRDWSEIPGRPVSPKCKHSTMNFSEIECSQDELDIVLSGTLKNCRNIIKDKEASLEKSSKKELLSTNNLDNSVIVLIDDEAQDEKLKVENIKEHKVYMSLKINDEENIIIDETISTVNKYRSGSPDLFDDDPSTIDDCQSSQESKSPLHRISKDITIDSAVNVNEIDANIPVKEIQGVLTDVNPQKLQNVTRVFNDVMDITECVNTHCVDIATTKALSPLKLSQNVTKRQSNDFMEITNCVVKPLLPFEADIDLTQSPDNENIVEPGITQKEKMFEVTNQDHTVEIVSIVEKEKNVVDLAETEKIEDNRKENACLDLTQSSNTSDELPFVSLKATKYQSADNTIIIDPKDYEEMRETSVVLDNNVVNISLNNADNYVSNNIQKPEVFLDLTQEIPSTSGQNSKLSEANVSFFDDYVHNHSDNNDNNAAYDNFDEDMELNNKNETSMDKVEVNINKDVESTKAKPNIKPNVKSNNSIDIDLTQSSVSSEEFTQLSQKNQVESETANITNDELYVKTVSDNEKHFSQILHSEEFIKDHGNNLDGSDSDSTIELEIITSSQRCSSLGKKDNVSIDYDELYDNMLSQLSKSRESRTSKTDNNTSNVSSKDLSNCSQNSEVFVISDNELDYSIHQSKLDKPTDNFLFGGISIMDELSGLGSFRKSTNIENNSSVAYKDLNTDNIDDNINKTPVKHKRVNELATPQKPGCSGINLVETPNNQYIIKTADVTPKPQYDAMSLEELHEELDKFGVKPFKRKRAVQLLTHIYNQTHPTAEHCSDEESPCKRRRTNNHDSPRKLSSTELTPRKILSPKKTAKSPRKSPNKVARKRKEISKDRHEESIRRDIEIVQNKKYAVNETPVIKEAECSPNDWVFQKREKAKVHSCRVPLHIAFHNYVLSRPALREAILCYEPINIDDIHKDLVGYGHRYDPKDLLKYMDKKCITVKTTDNDARNSKR